MYRMYLADEKNTILLPVTPGKISTKINGKNKTITLINEGEVNMIKAPGLTDIAIDKLILPMMNQYPFAQYENGFQPAGYFLEKLSQFKNSQKPITFVLTRKSPDDKTLLFDTNMKVTLEQYEIVEDAGEGLDIVVKLDLKQYVFWGSKKLVIKKSNNVGNKLKAVGKKATRQTKTPATTYTVRTGDSLFNIAKKQLNDASKWKKIYELNKKVIESTAKKHGRKSSSNGKWIYAGTKLKLPT